MEDLEKKVEAQIGALVLQILKLQQENEDLTQRLDRVEKEDDTKS